MKKINKNFFIKIVLPIILLIALIIIGYVSIGSRHKVLSEKQAAQKAETFINNFLMQSGNKATIKEVTSEYGLYKLKIDIVNDVVESYISKDGKLFFPQALNIQEITAKANAKKAPAKVAANVPKSDKPKVELFVMSYCPFGTQMEKGLIPVLNTLKDKIDFNLEFVDYSMHGKKELDENLLDYCIQKEDNDKLIPYLTCFLDQGKSKECLKSVDVNMAKVSKCEKETDAKYKITANYKNKKDYKGSYPGFAINKEAVKKYGVNGSPTLVINGKKVQSGRDSATLLATICSAFKNPPKECQAKLSSTAPGPGFGFDTTSKGGTATCN